MHAIYWKLHASFLRNDRKNAEKFLSMLDDEVRSIGLLGGERLREEIGDAHVLRYEKIRQRMAIGEFGRLYGQGTSAPELPQLNFKPEPSLPEKEFHRKLRAPEGKAALLRAMGAMDWAEMIPEVDMAPFGRCDFVVREGRRVHVVEIKVGQAPASVVSQIDKYRLCSELEMCMGLHDEVMAVVVAESFPNYVTTELSRMSVSMLTHRGTVDSIVGVTI